MSGVKLGVLGMGAMGMRHAEDIFGALAPDCELHGVWDPSAERREAAKQRFPGVYAHETEEALLASGVEAVLLAGPHSVHGPQAIAALSRGLHVLTEKPVGVRASEVEKAVAIAREKSLVYCVMFNQRATQLHSRIKALLMEGAIGAVRRALVINTDCYRPQSYFDAGAWRATWRFEGGGMLVNQCSHTMDLLQWWLGTPCRVNAQIGYGKWHDIEVDDDFSVYMAYENGATVNFIGSTGDVPGASLLEIQGDRGKITVDKNQGNLILHRLDMPEGEFSRKFSGGIGSPDVSEEILPIHDADRGHLNVLRNFIASIRGEAAPYASAEDANRSLRVTQAVYLSSWLGRDVTLPMPDAAFDIELDKRVAQSRPRTVKPVHIDFGAVWAKRK